MKPRIGIIGTGSIFPQHANGFVNMRDKCEVTAICSRHEEGWPAAIKHLEGMSPRCYKDYRELVAADDVDAVDILLPHDLHLDAVIQAAEHGKNILLEKVMSRNIYEGQQMLDVCKANGVSLYVCHDRRFFEDWVAIKDLIDSGKIGKPLFYRLDHNQPVAFWPENWNKHKDRIGGGAIMSCLTHQIDALRWFEGEIDSLYALSCTVPQYMEGECIGAILCDMKSGAKAELTINWHSYISKDFQGEHVHVTGTKGEAYFCSGRGSFFRSFSAPENAPFEPLRNDGWGSSHQNCVKQWVQMLRGEPFTLTTTGEDSLKTVMVAEAAYESINRREKVKLPIQPLPWGNR